MMNTIHDLADQARNGDKEALSDLVELLRPRLFAAAYQELRHYQDAQDAVAAALHSICVHIGELRDAERTWPWMRVIVLNEAARIRGRKGSTSELLEDHTASSDDCRDVALAIDIRNALRRLPRDNARTLALFYLSGLSVSEIACRTGRPVGTIKRWLHFGRRQMAIEMEDYAPMETTKKTVKAVIASTDIPAERLQRFVRALEEAGFDSVGTVIWPLVFESAGGDKSADFELPVPLEDVRLMIIDEWVAGRSAFEIQVAMKAAAHNMYFGILLCPPIAESTIFAAWAAGFELCVAREIDPSELARLSKDILVRIREEN